MGRRQKVHDEDRVIGDFRRIVGTGLGQAMDVVSHPDRESKDNSGCDVILTRGGEHWAVDITGIESYPGMEHDDARLRRLKKDVEAKLKEEYPDSDIEISIQLPQRTPRKPRLTTDELLKVLRKCLENTPQDASGIYSSFEEPPLAPRVTITRSPRYGESARCRCGLISREVGQLCLEAVKRSLRAKDDQLKPYKEQQLSTALIMDYYDWFLGSVSDAAKAFHTAWQEHRTKYIDEIWLARSILPDCYFYCLFRKQDNYVYSGGRLPTRFG